MSYKIIQNRHNVCSELTAASFNEEWSGNKLGHEQRMEVLKDGKTCHHDASR